MKKFIKGSMALILVVFSVGFLAACRPSLDPETETEVVERVDQAVEMLAELFGGADWWGAVEDGASDKVLAAIRHARFTNDEVVGIIDLLDNADDGLYLLTQFNDLDISSDKFARFMFSLAREFSEIAEDALPADLWEVYSEVLAFGERDFVAIFSALIDIATIESAMLDMNLGMDGLPSRNEFGDIVRAYRNEVLAITNILTANTVNTMGRFIQIFTPMIADSAGFPVAEINEQIDFFTERYAALRLSIRAAINVLDNNAVIDVLFNHMIEGADDDGLVIVIGRMLHAGFTVRNGINQALANEFLDLVLGFVGLPASYLPFDVSTVFAGAAYLNGLALNATINTENSFVLLLQAMLQGNYSYENDSSYVVDRPRP
ncbi:MAG: hypothetical protein FWE36_06885 [Erysipelotrichales bacterium]|nr:hypothetical protein [Erysipelotrichales bacterium]